MGRQPNYAREYDTKVFTVPRDRITMAVDRHVRPGLAMSTYHVRPIIDVPRTQTLVRSSLTVIAVLVGVVTLAGLGGAMVVLSRRGDSIHSIDALLFTGVLVLGLTAWAVTTAAILVVRQFDRLASHINSLDQRTAILAEQAIDRAQLETAIKTLHDDLTNTRKDLQEIRELLMLPNELRERRFQALVERESKRRLAAAEGFINSRDFHRARRELAVLTKRFGQNDRIRDAEKKLEQAADAVRGQDIADVTTRIEELMTITQWEEAVRAAQELGEKYPEAIEPQRLIEHVERERNLFEEKHRKRLYEEIQQFVNQRRWREAERAAERFIETFPTGADTDLLHQQMETLKANAEIEIRQQLERHIKEYMKQKQYWDALELARRLINEYPFSPQADALRNQLGQLEELARKQGPQK